MQRNWCQTSSWREESQIRSHLYAISRQLSQPDVRYSMTRKSQIWCCILSLSRTRVAIASISDIAHRSSPAPDSTRYVNLFVINSIFNKSFSSLSDAMNLGWYPKELPSALPSFSPLHLRLINLMSLSFWTKAAPTQTWSSSSRILWYAGTPTSKTSTIPWHALLKTFVGQKKSSEVQADRTSAS